MRGVCQRLKLRVNQGGRELHGFLAHVLHGAASLHVVLHRGVVPLFNGLHLLHRVISPRVDLFSGLPGEALVCAHVVRRVVGLVQAAHDCVVLVVQGVQRGGFLDCINQLHEALVHRALNHDSCSFFRWPTVRFGRVRLTRRRRRYPNSLPERYFQPASESQATSSIHHSHWLPLDRGHPGFERVGQHSRSLRPRRPRLPVQHRRRTL